MIEEANKKLLGMKDLKKAVIGSKKKDNKKDNKPVEDVEENLPLQQQPAGFDDDRANRENWKHPLDFLFSCISVSVGLGSKQQSFIFKVVYE